MTVYLSLLVALVGFLMFKLSGNPDTKEVGRISFFSGLLAFLIRFGPDSIAFLK